jgi:hypothetical protein
MATTLTVTFEYMFMLVKSRPPVVLMPKGSGDLEHALSISGIRDENAIDLSGADLRICTQNPRDPQDYVTYTGQQPSAQRWPDPDWILDFCNMSTDVAARRIDKRSLGAGACPSDLNGRFWLPYGQFKEAASDKLLKHREQRWEVPRPGKPRHHQPFTDVMRFVCELDPNELHYLEVVGSSTKRYPLQGQRGNDVTLWLRNEDLVERSSNYMDDVALLYALAKDPSGWPLPKIRGTLADKIPFRKTDRATFQPFGPGDDRPICGAGQGCPEP